MKEMSDKTHYTINHVLSYVRQIVFGVLICWVAVKIQSAWPLWALLLPYCTRYIHDFQYAVKDGVTLAKLEAANKKHVDAWLDVRGVLARNGGFDRTVAEIDAHLKECEALSK
jgi:hypothetical protein